MGLSSSQARLLNLTGRMHQIEHKAAKIQADKLRMANESKRVYQEYQNALEQTKLQVSVIQSDGSIDFIDATYNNLVERGYDLRFEGEDKVLITPLQEEHYLAAREEGGKEYFAALETERINQTDNLHPVTQNGETAYEVYTSADLKNALNGVNGKLIRLMSDIDASKCPDIITYLDKAATNVKFDGNGHSISGLTKALFNSIDKNSSISNLNIVNSKLKNTDGALLVYSLNGGSISNVSVSGTIDNSGYEQSGMGGIVGGISVDGGTIENCSASVTIYGYTGTPTSNTKLNTGSSIGGIVGQMVDSAAEVTIKNCSVSNTHIEGRSLIGGFAGKISNATIENCSVSSTSLNAHNQYYHRNNPDNYANQSLAGGFAGDIRISNPQSGGAYTSTLTNCSVSDCTIKSNYAYNGGFTGTTSAGTYTNCSVTNTFQNINSDNITLSQKYEFYGTFAGESLHISGLDNSYGPIFNNCYSNSEIIDLGSHSVEYRFLGGSSYDEQPTTAQSANNVTVTPPNIRTNIYVEGADAAKSLWDDIQERGYTLVEEDDPRIEHGDDNRWLTNMVNEGYLFIYKKDKKTNEYYQVSVSTDTALQEVDDEKELRKAEAKYEADMRRIDNKDRKFDYDLAALDAERNAIKQEMETLKTVAKDNVERTFKLFG